MQGWGQCIVPDKSRAAKKAEFTSPIFLVHKLSHSLNFIQLMVIEKSAALTRYPLNSRADVPTSWSLGMVVCASASSLWHWWPMLVAKIAISPFG